MSNRIHLSLPHMSGKEQDFIKEAFDTNWIVPLGPNIDGFEKDLSQYLGNNSHIAALSSGTAALHLALVMLNVKPGDEIICQSFTFAGSANPVAYVGAEPIFVDSEKDTWNMSPVFLRQAIEDRIAKTGQKPKAIIIVELYGMPAKMDEILDIANQYEIPVIEDAAEALGSQFKKQACGTFGKFSAISFNGNKIITTSGGGVLVCKTPEEAEQVKFFSTQARDNAPYYQHSHIGYNYRLSNVCAGIGRGQMLVLEDRILRRREINTLYRKGLSDFKSLIEFQTEPDERFYSNYWLTSIQLPSNEAREQLRLKLETVQIGSCPTWKPMHLQPVFAGKPFYGDGTSEELFNRGLCLPSGSILTNGEIQEVIQLISKFLFELMSKISN